MSESVIARHTELGNSYQLWMHTAQRLLAGSKILRRDRQRVDANLPHRKVQSDELLMPWIELMLTAFGIECLIKAIWVKHGHQLARDGKYIPMIQSERHQLVKLCRVAEIPIDDRETDALERITDIAGTTGRYPIARRASQIATGCSWSEEDFDIIENLILRLNAELRK